jgi:hypothetical protein
MAATEQNFMKREFALHFIVKESLYCVTRESYRRTEEQMKWQSLCPYKTPLLYFLNDI